MGTPLSLWERSPEGRVREFRTLTRRFARTSPRERGGSHLTLSIRYWIVGLEAVASAAASDRMIPVLSVKKCRAGEETGVAVTV